MRRFFAVSTALLAMACGPGPGVLPISELDAVFYVDHVHPVVRFTCASLACHGSEARPLRIYAEDGLRLRADLRGQPVDPEEVAWNVAAFGGIDPVPTDPDHSLVLLKPLSRDAGGDSHTHSDLDLWPNREDDSYVCLRAWLVGDTTQAAVCDAAGAALDPYPPAP